MNPRLMRSCCKQHKKSVADISNANKLSKNSSKSKALNSQSKRKGCFIFLLHILQCLVHFIHILSDSLFCCSNLAHTVSLAERFKFFMQSLVHTDIQIFDFFLVVIFHICYLIKYQQNIFRYLMRILHRMGKDSFHSLTCLRKSDTNPNTSLEGYNK